MNRFDYVRYDALAQAKSEALKAKFMEIEHLVDTMISVAPGAEGAATGRSKALILTQLEIAYMWVGKAIRDEQLALRGAELQEERSNS